MIVTKLVAVEPEAADHFRTSIRPALVKYCGDCHLGEEADEAPFLNTQKASEIGKQRTLWHSASIQLHNRTMPPKDSPQPSEHERLRLAGWIETHLRATACEYGDFARYIPPRRLNRLQYDNTMRDLFGIDLRLSESFPADGGGGEGFDNNGETLFLPPLLLERYLEAATFVLEKVILVPPQQFELDTDNSVVRKQTNGWMVRGSEVIHRADLFRFRLTTTKPPENTRIILKVDGIQVGRFRWKEDTLEENVRRSEPIEVRLAKGLHVFSVHVFNADSISLQKLRVESKGRTVSEDQQVRHDRIFITQPADHQDNARKAASVIVSAFADRAFRRPVTKEESAHYLAAYDRLAERGSPFELCVEQSLKAVLLSPHFLFRIEKPTEATEPVPLPDTELASRLSCFLWASMPDERLRNLARDKKLRDGSVLTEEVHRMLNDAKARALFDDFTGQWLGTREVGGRKVPEASIFKDVYKGDLPVDLRQQAAHLMAFVVRDNRSLLELLDSDYAILNQQLAKHYGIDGVRGDDFRKVVLKDRRRSGVLGLGGVHVITSYPTRTSPVLRGTWILDTLFGTPVPSPPANVPPLKKGKKSNEASLREELAKHREHATCAACHDLVDPLGFALENFDAIGRWRDKAADKTIDVSGKLPSGEEISGPAELKKVLLKRKDDFLRTLTEKMLGYALGRSLEDRDQCAVQKITTAVAADEYRARTLITQVVLSVPFRRTARHDGTLPQP